MDSCVLELGCEGKVVLEAVAEVGYEVKRAVFSGGNRPVYL